MLFRKECYEFVVEEIGVLEELKSIVQTKLIYDYMECCALEKVSQDILAGRKVDWTAVDNIRLLMDELLNRLENLYHKNDRFLQDLFEKLDV